MKGLSALGWGDFFEQQISPEDRLESTVARIVEPLRGLSRAVCPAGELWAECSEKPGPSIGDWVVGHVRRVGPSEIRLSIDRILKRRSVLSRAAPGGKGYAQILCANADVAFVVLAVTQQLNPPGVQRLLAAVRESGLAPVIVLTKADDLQASAAVMKSVEAIAAGAPVHCVSVFEGRGIELIEPYFAGGKTVVLLGASGAGKSTLVNHLLGAAFQRIEQVRESDQKGRHTTTARRLYLLPSGGMVIDSPGFREMVPWEGVPVSDSSKTGKLKKPYAGPRGPRGSAEE